MSLWFGPYAGFPPDSGYFYLCPVCYRTCITPHAGEVLHRLTEAHPARHGLPLKRARLEEDSELMPETETETETEAEAEAG